MTEVQKPTKEMVKVLSLYSQEASTMIGWIDSAQKAGISHEEIIEYVCENYRTHITRYNKVSVLYPDLVDV